MARPQALQFLRKGALLVGKVFPRFVETWNWLVGAFDSMVGDGDIDPKGGAITVDRTNPDRPVIRLNKAKVGGGGETGDITVVGDDDTKHSGHEIKLKAKDDTNIKFDVTDSGGVITVEVGVYYRIGSGDSSNS